MKYQTAFMFLTAAAAAEATATTRSDIQVQGGVRGLEEKQKYCAKNYRGSLSRTPLWGQADLDANESKSRNKFQYKIIQPTDDECLAKMDVKETVCNFRMNAFRRESYSLNDIEFNGRLKIFPESKCVEELDTLFDYCALDPPASFLAKYYPAGYEVKTIKSLNKQQAAKSHFLKKEVPLEECTDTRSYCLEIKEEFYKEHQGQTAVWADQSDIHQQLVDMSFCEAQAAAEQKVRDDAAAEITRIDNEAGERFATLMEVRTAMVLADAQQLETDWCAEVAPAKANTDQAQVDKANGTMGGYAARLVDEEWKRHRNYCAKATHAVQQVEKKLKHEAFSQEKKVRMANADLQRQGGVNGLKVVSTQTATNAQRRPRLPGAHPKIEGVCLEDHVCARVAGDPHIKTFDGLSYDCQGHGEFVLVRDLNSRFEIQGRFADSRSSYARSLQNGMVTGVRAISIDTGVEGAPKLDVIVEEADGDQEKGCYLNYYVDGQPADFGEDGKAIPGLEFHDEPIGRGNADLLYFPDTGLAYTVYGRYGNFGCMLGNDICLPKDIAESGSIVGLFGTPNSNRLDDWMDVEGKNLVHGYDVGKVRGYDYCTQNWCVGKNESIFGYLPGEEWEDFSACNEPYSKHTGNAPFVAPTPECAECCGEVPDLTRQEQCLTECATGNVLDCENFKKVEDVFDLVDRCDAPEPSTRNFPPPTSGPKTVAPTIAPTASPTTAPVELTNPPAPDSGPTVDTTTTTAFTRGDPHFKTFGGEMYDYHGECDLVLLHNPQFKDNMGMDIHIRTKIQDFWSSVESAAVQLGKDTIEISSSTDSDEWLWINGKSVTSADEELNKWHKTEVGGFLVRYQSNGKNKEAKIYLEHDKDPIELRTFLNFVKVDINFLESENYSGSTGLLGSHADNGARLGRDGKLIANVNDFGQDWQVTAHEARMFHTYKGAVTLPDKCVLPAIMGAAQQLLRRRRLDEGMDVQVAEKACAHLSSADDRKACVFDVVATQDVNMASVW